MERQSTSLIIYGFALITVLYFIPSCLAARQLLDFPPQNNTVGENHEHDDQSKSGVHGSESDHAGSATGDTPPSSVVNRPPSPISYQTNNNPVRNGGQSYSSQSYSSSTSNNGNCRVTRVVNNGNTQTTTTGSGCNNNGNGGGYYAPPPPYYGGNPYYYYTPGSGYGNSGYP